MTIQERALDAVVARWGSGPSASSGTQLTAAAAIDMGRTWPKRKNLNERPVSGSACRLRYDRDGALASPRSGTPGPTARSRIKEATVKRYHYDSHRQLETHLHDFIDAYNYGRRLKTLKGLTPFEYICKI